jgi:hypothetical protein
MDSVKDSGSYEGIVQNTFEEENDEDGDILLEPPIQVYDQEERGIRDPQRTRKSGWTKQESYGSVAISGNGGNIE